MKTFATAALAALLLLPANAPAIVAQDDPATPDVPGIGPVFVDRTDILYLESWPVQVHLSVSGHVPTPCHDVAWEVQLLLDRIDVLMWSVADPEAMCTQVLDPFEVGVPLGSFEAVDLPVVLNGEVVGRAQVGDPPDPFVLPIITDGGYSFGFCLGYCRTELTYDGEALSLSGFDREGSPALYTNTGTLTAAGRDTLDAALAAIGDQSLDEVYGCPDCADGGAASISLVRGGVAESVLMEFANPPDVLADLYEIQAGLIAALEGCISGELVEVTDDCVPYER